ncbi:MAG: hypothetical protein K0Q43_104 [Ramlibacter sp.]|jgi:hypothetical protein|nr:hypothetical protein [Ramlibacter sp.]
MPKATQAGRAGDQSMIPLFQISVKPGLREPPVQLICQSLTVDGEMLLWVDGVNAQDPVVIPLSAVSSTKLLTDFETFMDAHKSIARRVLLAGAGEISPTIAARAVSAMAADPRLDATDALELVNGQALDLLDADAQSAAYFWGAAGPVSFAAVAGAA